MTPGAGESDHSHRISRSYRAHSGEGRVNRHAVTDGAAVAFSRDGTGPQPWRATKTLVQTFGWRRRVPAPFILLALFGPNCNSSPFRSSATNRKSIRPPVWGSNVVTASRKARRVFIVSVGRLQIIERHLPQPDERHTRLLAYPGE